jgi:hypothetical protein
LAIREIRDIRLANLRLLVHERAGGNVARFVELAGLESHKALLQVTGPRRTRNVGTGLARRIEHGLGLKRGWMDQDHAATTDTTPVPDGRTERALRLVQLIERLPPDVRGLVEQLIDALTAAKPMRRRRRKK